MKLILTPFRNLVNFRRSCRFLTKVQLLVYLHSLS
uniref:Uncharacterized protein n=1 Tax=Arundo donax TaxID=35708 RepID=A0A0A9BC92_ARUDO